MVQTVTIIYFEAVSHSLLSGYEQTLTFSWQAHHYPMIFDVPVTDRWFMYVANPTFYENTQFPLVGLSIYNALREEFEPMLTWGGVFVNEHTHPWVLVWALGLQDNNCFCLYISIQHVYTLQTGGHTAEVGIDVCLNEMRGHRNASIELDSGDDNSDLEMDWIV